MIILFPLLRRIGQAALASRRFPASVLGSFGPGKIRALLFTLAMLPALGSALTSARAERVLVVADPQSAPNSAAEGLIVLLTKAEHAITRAFTLPTDLSGYDQLWDLNANVALTTAEQSTIIGFLQAGKRAFVMGENTDYGAARNATIIPLLSALGAGTVAIVDGDSNQTVNAPWNGSTNTIKFPASASFTSAGNGSFITQEANGAGAAIAFSAGTMANAPSGTLALVLDVNFLQQYFSSYPGCLALSQALVAYVGGEIVEEIVPTITAVTVPGAGGYRAGATLEFTVTFNSPVSLDVTDGAPRLALTLGAAAVHANYVSSSNDGLSLVFSYTVEEGDNDADGITLAPEIELNGSTIRDAADSSKNATLTFTAPATTAVLVDTEAPLITSASVPPAVYGSSFAGYTIIATDATTLTYGASALPPGLSVNPQTGAITGTPATAGSFVAEISAADAAGNVATTTVTFTVAPVSLDVAGLVVTDKIYDGSTAATLVTSGASLVGVLADDEVTLDASGASGAFATANVGAGQVVTIGGLALSGSAAGNYLLVPPTVTASITPALATVTLSGLNHVYDGTAKSAAVASLPAGLSINVSYAGGGAAPIDAGSYAVVAKVSDANYVGSASGALVVAKADQTVAFSPIGEVAVDAPVAVQADASSGLEVAVTLVSGDATLDGATLTVASAASDVVVKATQSGNANYNAAVATLTIPAASIVKLPQTITFADLPGVLTTAEPITLAATASSGLDVTYTLVSGPATLSGNTVTLTGATGTAVITASQAGNDVYAAAPSVTRSFAVAAVGPQVFFGNTAGDDTLAANVAQDNSTGTIIGYLGGSNEGFVLTFTPDEDGSFSGTATTFAGTSPDAVTQLSIQTMVTNDASTPKSRTNTTIAVAAATAGESDTLTFTGTIVDGVMTGLIEELGLTFTLQMQPQTGPTAEVAGYYTAEATATATGTVYSVVGTQNVAYVLAVTSEALVAGTTALTADYTFVFSPSAEITLAGALSAEAQTVTGTVTIAGEITSYSGTSSTTERTDRLLNLSSRAQVGATGEQTLIAGFVVGGSEAKTVLLRAVGPALAKFGVTNPLAAPRLQLFDRNGRLLREVAGWGGDTTLAGTFESAGAFAYDTNSQDAALVATLAPGVYTMHVSGKGATGVALAEIYDVSATSGQQRLLNISSRGNVSGGDGVLIGGFVVGGNAPKRVLIRGVGPGLAAYGVTAPLANPTLTLYSGSEVVARNDNWETPVVVNDSQTAATASELAEAATATGAFTLTAGSTDAALIVTLAPGAYTVHVGSGSGTTGIALVEVYEIPE